MRKLAQEPFCLVNYACLKIFYEKEEEEEEYEDENGFFVRFFLATCILKGAFASIIVLR